jgi:hypothetical protein
MQRLLFFLFIFGAAAVPEVFSATQEQKAGEPEAGCFQLLTGDDLSAKIQGPSTINLDADEGVTFRLTRGRTSRKQTEPHAGWMRISVLERGKRVTDLPESRYGSYGILASGDDRYWMIREYTGEQFCCLRYHFFGRGENRSLQYLGATQESPPGLEGETFLCRDGQVYLKIQDIRFLHFHTPQVKSRLVFAIHYRLSPVNIAIDNKPFREEYLRERLKTEQEIQTLVEKRQSTPVSILLERKESGFFADDLGQLLVKKAVLHLFAGEEIKAWSTLEKDIEHHYQTIKGSAQIRAEIKRILRERSQ